MVEAVTMRGGARSIVPLARFLSLLALLAFPFAGFAHRLDEYLQATLVAIEPGGVRLQINLTPGTAVAMPVIALIDGDRDSLLSTNEANAYAELFKRDLSLRLDGRPLELISTAFKFPEPAELRTGWGFIQLEFSATPGPLAPGPHELTLANGHQTNLSVYLINAALPKASAIQITRQTRNENQSAGRIDFTFQPPSADWSCAKRIVLPLGGALVVLCAGAVIWWRRKRDSATVS